MRPKKVCLIGADYPTLELYCPNWHGMKRGLEKLGIEYIFVSCRPSLDVEAIIAFQPDLIVYGLKDMIVHEDWRRKIREDLPDAKIVIWYGDYRDDQMDQIDADCSEVDAMFVSNDAQGDYYKRKWKVPVVHFLPLACEPIESPKKSRLYMGGKFDFIFIGGQITGTGFYKRSLFVENLKLKGNLTVINSFDDPIRARIFREMPSIYSSAKICLDVSHFIHVQGYTSIRFWEIPAFWGFALTQRWPGCTDYYPEDSRAYFDDFDEALEKKDYYLQHDKERERMIAKAHKLSYTQTYKERFTQMFQTL